MNQRPRYLGDLFRWVVCMLALPVVGCGNNGTPALGNDAGSDVGPTIDRQALLDAGMDAGTPGDALGTDVGRFSDRGPSLTSVRAAITRAAMTGDGGTPLDVDLAVLWVTDTVAATSSDGGVSADDPAGFFVQGPGGAIFVAIAPATLSPPPQRGDFVYFTATRGEVHAGARWITDITNYGVIRRDPSGAPSPLDLSAADLFVAYLDEYEHALVRVQGTIAGDFADAGTGFESALITTAGIPVATPDLALRVPVALRRTMNLRRGCTFTAASPLWRHDAQAQVHVWTADHFTPGGCPGDADGGIDAGSPDAVPGLDVPTSDVSRDVPTYDPCSIADDLSAGTPGSDGTIRISSHNHAAPAAGLGDLGLLGAGDCLGQTSGGAGAVGYPMVFRYTMHSTAALVASTDNPGTDGTFNSVVAVLPTCTAAARPLACNDDVASDGTTNRRSTARSAVALPAGQVVYVVVEGWGPTAIDASTGAFELSIREQRPIAVGGACRAGELCVTGATCVGATPTAAGTCVAHD
ncbi:MAG: hypothetical protein EPO40_21070 [Myxococcaceae bacterium]|nr:MAG: hypothetical protein EPO40_21070 [Myxococcaceae bacterium]